MRRFVLLCLIASACRAAPTRSTPGDTAFAALQTRGQQAMGVDQYTSTHQFDDLPDGGRIALQRDPADTAGVRTIREHLQHIAGCVCRRRLQPPGLRARRHGAGHGRHGGEARPDRL